MRRLKHLIVSVDTWCHLHGDAVAHGFAMTFASIFILFMMFVSIALASSYSVWLGYVQAGMLLSGVVYVFIQRNNFQETGEVLSLFLAVTTWPATIGAIAICMLYGYTEHLYDNIVEWARKG